MKLELVSHPLCPFVHRTAILLREKGLAYSTRYVEDLKNKPDWLLAISPRGKVPLLAISNDAQGEKGPRTVLFESAIINEYLDDVYEPRLSPSDPLEHARQRAWIEVSGDLFGAVYGLTHGATEHEYEAARVKAEAIFAQLEDEIRGEYFAGDALSLVDVAFAPAFHRLALLEKWSGASYYVNTPKVDAWARRVAGRPSVKEAVPADFEERFRATLTGAFAARLVA